MTQIIYEASCPTCGNTAQWIQTYPNAIRINCDYDHRSTP